MKERYNLLVQDNMNLMLTHYQQLNLRERKTFDVRKYLNSSKKKVQSVLEFNETYFIMKIKSDFANYEEESNALIINIQEVGLEEFKRACFLCTVFCQS